MANERVVRNAEKVAAQSEASADRLSVRAGKTEYRRNLVDIASILVGLSALFVELIPKIAHYVGDTGQTVVSLFAGTFLVAQVAMEKLISRSHPDRLRDYAFYTDHCAKKIRRVLARDHLNNPELDFWVEMAETQLVDARTKFPDLVVSYVPDDRES